jgi:coenzyme F420-reducing hydrogenase delta subunit/ferredoxin
MGLDWFFLAPHALAGAITPAGLWIALGIGAAALAALPWVPGPRTVPAVVNLDQCNGCARCAADCPFGAVVMAPRSDGRPHAREARVLPDLCAACGICTGACPSSTPFRRAATLASGIDLPALPIDRLRGKLDRALDRTDHAVIAFACAAAGNPAPHASPRVVRIEVECAAMVPPAFVEYALRAGAAGIVLAGCREGDCEYRLGDRWTAERIAGARAPALRAVVPRERVRVAWCGADGAAFTAAIDSLLGASPESVRRPPVRRPIPKEVPHA